MNQEKTYNQLIEEIMGGLNKLSNSEINMDEAIALFEGNLQKINAAKKALEDYKGKVVKVLADNKIAEFEV
ncbi:exodeoxyribonuclease VII small subunit [Williamsoniiplasma lucivorax]|uniref:Exodeoxyribonuclease VII small subunit n=1 Tax=Williamsoniiplasma lucivorax TaxID=209274 RepID=A0A2S5RCW3_9MOLU|nr:exodeoxyribonuclease VII small subunit [Williamsoniiplasma lucivorax]PPE05150.1 exodeoxyribonuclease VII small subunit [Williamsoniiplasma lucivorax]